MDRSVRIAEITWMEYVRRVREESPVVLLPMGALEQHGPHLPMNCDVVIPTALSERVAARTGGLVAPALAYGYKSQPRSGGGNHFPGTTSLDGATLTMLVRDLVREFARHGVRNIAVMDGHYENTMFGVEGIDLALRELRVTGVADMKIMRIAYYEFTSESTLAKVWPDGFGGWALEHAGVMETSAMLYLRPEAVHMERVPDHPPASFPPYDVYPVTETNVPAVPSSGALVSARLATREKGELLFEEWVRGISAAVADEFAGAAKRAAMARP